MSNLPPKENELDEDNRGNLLSDEDANAKQMNQVSAQQSISAHPYQRLTPDVVIDAVESTERLSDARILALNSYENRVYQVGIEGSEPVIVKFYRPDRWTCLLYTSPSPRD